MSATQSIQIAAATGRYSKRKRAQVNYYEEDAAEVEYEKGNQSQVEYSLPKKRRSAPSSKPLPKRKIFPFLQLPAEIRNIIYENCLSDPAGIYLEATTKKYRRTVQRCPEDRFRYFPAMPDSDDGASDSGDEEKGPRKESRPGMRRLVPSLLAVCKQINQEGRDILYGNHFYLADTLAMHSFLVDLTPRGASLLKQITLICWGQGRGIHKAYNHAGFAALASATNLEKFKVHGYRGWSADSKSVARTFYRDAFPWLEAVGAAKGKLDAAVDIIEVACNSFTGQPIWWLNTQRNGSGMYKDMDGFRAELNNLLGGRMKMIKSRPR